VNINFKMISLTVGVLALQGGFSEHIDLVRKAAEYLSSTEGVSKAKFHCIEVRTKEQLDQCNALIIPGGESTTISFVAAQSGLLEPLRDFVKYAIPYSLSRSYIQKCSHTNVKQSSEKTSLGNLRWSHSSFRRSQCY
jgi:glutamine amidotransferase PdxT